MAAVSRLTRQLSEERASLLATEALSLARSGKLEVSWPPQSEPIKETKIFLSKRRRN